MAYDAPTQQVVLFGGTNADGSSPALNDTWTWNGHWSRRSTVQAPPGRMEAAMAYDPRTRTIVLFGGDDTDGTWLTDTWIWDGAQWHLAKPATTPPARRDAAMAYDDALGAVVMFGGWNPVVGGPAKLNDTWAWDGSTWTQLFPATVPRKRAGAQMAYDAASGKLLMFGGDIGQATNETWTFDGRDWSRVPGPAPPPRDSFSMTQAAAGSIVVFGGEEPKTPPDGPNPTVGQSNDTWVWHDGSWTEEHPPLGVAVLYGGGSGSKLQALGDTSTWNGSGWREVSDNAHGSC
jgi:hypothetical protein